MSLNLAKFFPEGIGKWAASHYGLALLLALSIGLNGLLAWRAIYWRHRVQEAEAGQKGKRPGPPVATLPVLKGKHLDGSAAAVEFRRPGPPTLLYLLSPSCGWCAKNLPNLHALIEQSKNKYKIVTVSVTEQGLPEYAAKNHSGDHQVELIFGIPENVLQEQDLTATPQTLLISPEGKLVKRWQGAYDASNRADIEATLGVRLPGLVDTP